MVVLIAGVRGVVVVAATATTAVVVAVVAVELPQELQGQVYESVRVLSPEYYKY